MHCVVSPRLNSVCHSPKRSHRTAGVAADSPGPNFDGFIRRQATRPLKKRSPSVAVNSCASIMTPFHHLAK